MSTGTTTGATSAPLQLRSADDVMAVVAALAHLEPETEGAAIALVGAAESLKAASAATQARASSRLDSMRRAAEAERGVPVEHRGRGLDEEIALARRESPTNGGIHLRLARCLVDEMPRTLELMTAGQVPEWRATVVAKEIAFLAPDDRRAVDEALAPDLPTMGDRQAGNRARRLAQQLDQEAAVLRMDRAVHERRVTVRPAPNGMAYLTALMRVSDAVRVRATLERDARSQVSVGVAAGRTPTQIAADLLVERCTGFGVDEPRDVGLTLVMTDETMIGGPASAWIPGEGPVPAAVARGYLSKEQAADVRMRRIWVRPDDGEIDAADSRSRDFPKWLRHLVTTRDDMCRNPFCGAPLRQIDHVTRHADGGPTALANASGLCQRCNLVKENPGWASRTGADGLTVTTPTGASYRAGRSVLAQHATDRRIDELRARVAANREALRALDDEPARPRAGPRDLVGPPDGEAARPRAGPRDLTGPADGESARAS